MNIPAGFASNVQYEGDPGFGEKSLSPVPTRTIDSKLTSLGFRLRFPDFDIMTEREQDLDRRNYTIGNTPWLRVGVIAGPIYGDGQFLWRMVDTMNDDRKFQYEKLPDRQFGLDVYTPTTVDKSKRKYDPYSRRYASDLRDRDIFVGYDNNNRIETYIECDNVLHDAAPCSQYFNLGGPFRVKFTVGYRRGLLSNWATFRDEIRKLILEMKV